MKIPSASQGKKPDEQLTPGLRPVSDPGRTWWVRCLMQVLWPAFVGAAVTVGLLFSLVDPLQIEWVHVYLNDSRQASYTLGFLLLWIVYALTCGMTWYLATTETPPHRPGGNNQQLR